MHCSNFILALCTTQTWMLSHQPLAAHRGGPSPGSGISRLLRSKTGGSSTAGGPREGGTALIGEAIGKGHQAYSIMLALQVRCSPGNSELGIACLDGSEVGVASSCPPDPVTF
eukprot:scaffold168822_cov24-Tisochrysis_lutea.AAC.1